MTARPLAHDFAPRSELADRAPGDVSFADMVRELADERAQRATTYPHLINKGTLSAPDAARHMAIWRAIEADFAAAAPHQDHPGAPEANAAAPKNAVPWDDKIRELRRELALRRTAYPKWIAKPVHPLTATEAARKLAALDAIHWRYWHRLFAFTPAGIDPRTDLSRLAWIATREAERAKARADRTGGRQPDRTLLDAPATRRINPDRVAASRWRLLASWFAAVDPRPGFIAASASAYPAGIADHLAHAAAELDRRDEAVRREGERWRFAQVLDVYQWLEAAARQTDTACPLTRIFGTLPTPPQPLKEAA